MSERRGYSLVELLAVITVGSVMLGLCLVLLAGTFRAASAMRRHVAEQRGIGRLADQFRRDVHAATEHREGGLPSSRQFQLTADRAVTYQIEPGKVTRTEQVGGTEQHRESFALLPRTEASIQAPGDAGPPIVSLVLTTAKDAHARRVLRIDAALARDHRLGEPRRP